MNKNKPLDQVRSTGVNAEDNICCMISCFYLMKLKSVAD